MMLEALVALAEREGLMLDPDFGMRRVDIQLRVSVDGRLLGVSRLGEHGMGLKLRAPVPPRSKTNPGSPAFLVENLQYVLGLTKPNQGSDNARKCFASYQALVTRAEALTNDPGLTALAAFLDSPAEIARAAGSIRDSFMTNLNPNTVSKILRDLPSRIAMPFLDEDLTPIHERSQVEAWWRTERRSRTSKEVTRGCTCLVTGQPSIPTKVHYAISFPGGPGTGTKLASFNRACPAFSSQGMKQGENAPISEQAAQGYARAIGFLLERAGSTAGGFRGALWVPPDSVLLLWTRDRNDTPALLLELFAPASLAMSRPPFRWRRLVPCSNDATPFYACMVASNMTRLVVRDWIETTAIHVKDNIRKYFEDLHIAGSPGEAVPIAQFLGALGGAPSGDDQRGPSSPLATRILRAALLGDRFPREALALSLRRLRLPPREPEAASVLGTRVALIKATLIRLHLHDPEPLEVTVSLDPNNKRVSYLLGRLFAACERLHSEALGRADLTIRGRFFGSASTTPALVFPLILRMSIHDVSRARERHRRWSERVKTGIIEQLPAGVPFPRTLDLEDQGLFAVGYYHQREDFVERKDTAELEAILDARTESMTLSTGTRGNGTGNSEGTL